VRSANPGALQLAIGFVFVAFIGVIIFGFFRAG
jgi:hypothetical protein